MFRHWLFISQEFFLFYLVFLFLGFQPSNHFMLFLFLFTGGSRTAATSKMELFVIIVNGFSRELLSQRAPSWMLQQS